MRLLDLHLLAYGPFTDRHIDLSSGSGGLHVIYGPNEAGKSSALRALRGLLYGIPVRTEDDFRHDKSELRVGGLLRGADGTELRCYRRKGRKKTLLDADGNAISEDRLTRLLGGVDERLFERLFGIDHAALVSGGDELLKERGREAEALFGAGLGSTTVRGLLNDLAQEAQDLFAPRASKPVINAGLGAHADIERRQREASLSTREWDEARKAVAAATRQLAEMEGALMAAGRRRTALERIRRTLPNLARRAGIRDELAAFGDVPALADDFGTRRESAMRRRTLAAGRRAGATSRLEGLRQSAATLDVSAALLAEADALDELRDRLGGHRKAALDRPGLDARLAALEESAGRRLAEIRPDLSLDAAERLRPLLGRQRRATDLGQARQAREADVRNARQRQEEVAEELKIKQEALGGLAAMLPHEGLQQAVEAARRAGDLDGAVEAAVTAHSRHDEDCRQALAALGQWAGSLADLEVAPLPVPETVNRFDADFRELDRERRRLEETIAELEGERRQAAEDLRALELAGAVPGEPDLDQARERRNQGWRLLRRQWVDGDDVTGEARAFARGRSLPDAFEDHVGAADDVADRLRRESQRVHSRAAGQAKLESCGARLVEVAAELKAVAERRRALAQDWQAVWAACAIVPLPPPEMAAWLEKARRLREKAAQGRELKGGAENLQRQRGRHLDALSTALTDSGAPVPAASPTGGLGALLDYADSRLGSVVETRRAREGLELEIAGLEEAVRRLAREAKAREQALSTWRAEWAGLMAELGLGQDATPGEVADYIEAVAEILRLVDEARDLRLRIAGIDQEALDFEETARRVVSRLAPDLSALPVTESIVRLHTRLADHRRARARLDELDRQARQAEEEVREADTTIRDADAALAGLCREAACDDPEALPAAEERSKKHRALAEELREVEQALVEGGDGLGIEALAAEAGAVDQDAVITELNALGERIEKDLRPRREAAFEEKIQAATIFEAMQGGDDASVLAEEAQQALSGIRRHAERYVRNRLAARVLRDEIERFRRKHRDPILSRAGIYLERLTCGSLVALDTDYDESDQPVLKGLRTNGERLGVEAMSTGTRDQLYLALRLATLDHYMESAEPLPFIVDDILIQFDDDRAGATLAALAAHASRSQVILFTHHGRVAEEARRLAGGAEAVFVHELE